ncbi:MAG TPA: DUF4426 domain-containing protein [Steroidobacteraceae bacterium]|nr:DUF4426 domain-containing protein [Steroidobacteraceae bacterium]
MSSVTRTFAAALLACALLASGCDLSSSQPRQRIATAQPSDESFRDFGAYEVHYNAVRTDALTAEIARSYGIQRSANRVMLNVTVLQKEGAQRKPVEAAARVEVRNMNEQLKNLELRRVSEQEAIYYIGEVSISGTEILVFDITVTPAGTQTPLSVKFTREFVST